MPACTPIQDAFFKRMDPLVPAYDAQLAAVYRSVLLHQAACKA